MKRLSVGQAGSGAAVDSRVTIVRRVSRDFGEGENMVMYHYTFAVSELLYKSWTRQHVAQNSLLNVTITPHAHSKGKYQNRLTPFRRIRLLLI